VVRKWAFQLASSVVPEDWARLRVRASRDSFSPIRRIAFESLEAEPNWEAEHFLPFLLDQSPSNRVRAQALIEKRFKQSAAEFYRNEILRGSWRQTRICVAGLAETGDRSDCHAMTRLLSDGSALTRCVVLRALRALKSDGDLDLGSMLATEVPSVAREAALSLLAQNSMPGYGLWQRSLQNPDPRVWLAILKVLNRTGKWTRLHVYVDAANISDAQISAYAVEQLQWWLVGYNRSFAQVASEERQNLLESFERVRAKLPAALVRDLDFVFQILPG
jgi:hypothetical protein